MDNEIHHYDGLVRAIARRYPLPDGWERSDLEQEGYIGLMNALRRYDPDGLHRNYAENTIVAFGIKTAIRKALRQATGYEPQEVPDIADQPTVPMALPDLRANAWLTGRITRPLPALPAIEIPVETPDPAPSVEEQVAAVVDGAQVSATLEAALLLLSARQRTIIERRYGLSGDGVAWTCEEVGKLLGIHKSNVSRAQQKALAVLRAHLSETRDGQIILHRFEEKRQRRTRTRATAA